MKRFCLLTCGRSGSTTLVRALASLPGVVVPDTNLDCPDNELLHPFRWQAYAGVYSRWTGRPIDTPGRLLEVYYEVNRRAGFVGFKTMPERHVPFRPFAARDDIQFIVLYRRDVVAAVASFMTAARFETWARTGGSDAPAWRYTEADLTQAFQITRYVFKSLKAMYRVENAIRVSYEDLVGTTFRCDALESFFGVPVTIESPRAPIDPREYLESFDAFESRVQGWLTRFYDRFGKELDPASW